MKSKLFQTIGLAALFVSAAQAQMARPVVATIPFDFTAGKTLFPAGEYTISPYQQGVIKLAKVNGKHGAFLQVNAEVKRSEVPPSLIFQTYGGSQFLSQVWTGASTGVRLPKSKVELARARELAQAAPKPETRILAMIR